MKLESYFLLHVQRDVAAMVYERDVLFILLHAFFVCGSTVVDLTESSGKIGLHWQGNPICNPI